MEKLLFIGMLILLVAGFVRCLQIAIRAFVGNRFWKGMGLLLLSLVIGAFVLGNTIIPYSIFKQRKDIARRFHCMNIIRNTLPVTKFYARDHDGDYPKMLNDMVGLYLKTNDVPILTGPSAQGKVMDGCDIQAWTDYAYVSGLKEADPTNCVEMFCPPENHNGGVSVVGFLGGRVEWVSCRPCKDSQGKDIPTFQDLTNTPSLFYGTTNEVLLADLKRRTRIIWPKRQP